MHSDRGRYLNPRVTYQSTIALEGASFDDHCFAYLRGSHRIHDQFFAQHPPGSLKMEAEADEAYTQFTYTLS